MDTIFIDVTKKMEAVKLEAKPAAPQTPDEEDEPIDEDDPYWQVRCLEEEEE